MKERDWNEQSRGRLTFHVLGYFHFLEFVIVECDHKKRYVVTGIGESLGNSSIEDYLNNDIYSVTDSLNNWNYKNQTNSRIQPDFQTTMFQ